MLSKDDIKTLVERCLRNGWKFRFDRRLDNPGIKYARKGG